MRSRALVAGSVLLAAAGCSSSGRPVASPNQQAAPERGGQALEGGKLSASEGARWHPQVGMTWQWQLSGRLDLSVSAQVYDVDLFSTSAAQVATLHARGRKVVCYVSVGSWEPYRPDSASFPTTLRGKALEGFPDERWLDIRATTQLLPLIAKRLDLCRSKGFDAVEPDNVDGFANDSGFRLRDTDQLRFNRAVAGLAHARGLAVALKNDLNEVAALVPSFDFAVNEQCVEYDECAGLSAFIRAGKPVFHVEYHVPLRRTCATTKALRFSSLVKRESLDSYRQGC